MGFVRFMIVMLLTALTAVAETRVRITGMRSKSEQQMLDLMGSRLEHVRASPASPPLADDAAFMLRELLRKDGYSEATVEWKVRGGGVLELMVNEGQRLSLGRVTVQGVDQVDAKKFSKLYSKPALHGRDFIGESPPFRKEDEDTGLSYLRQELNSRGYWNAEASVSNRMTNRQNGSVDMTIDVKPGPLYRIGQPTLTEVASKGAESILEAARPYGGRAATTANLNAMRLAVEHKVAGLGYPNAKIRMSRTLEGNRFLPVFTVELGERVKLAHVLIDGLERTDPARIENRLKGMEGDWYDESAMNRRINRFLSTGAFSSARVEKTPAGTGMIDATLHFEEARAREITLGAGAGSYEGFIVQAGYTDRNLFGKLLGFNAGLELSFLGLLGEVRVSDPWLFDSDMVAVGRIYALIYGREGYTVYQTGIEGKLTRKFGDHYTVELLAGYAIANLTADGLPASVLGENNYTNPRIRLTQTLDYRDNPVLPKSGWHVECPLEIGAATGGNTTSYVSAALSGGWYHPLGRRFDLGIGGEFGCLIPSGDGAELPIDLRLFNGGASSVRSFPERELGPSVHGYPTGGEAAWHANVELIRHLTDSVRAVAFVDAGSLARHYGDIGSAEVELAAGLGLRLDLPIGPVRFEYGFNLTQNGSEPEGTFHFAIGTAY